MLRAGDFFAAATPIAFLIGAFALVAAAGAAGDHEMDAVSAGNGAPMPTIRSPPKCSASSPRAIFARTFALASAFAGLSGFVDDHLLRRGRLWRLDDARPQGADRRDSRRHRLDSRRVSRRPDHRRFEAAWSAFLPIDYRDVAVFSLLAIVLVLRPGGIMGLGAIAPRAEP